MDLKPCGNVGAILPCSGVMVMALLQCLCLITRNFESAHWPVSSANPAYRDLSLNKHSFVSGLGVGKEAKPVLSADSGRFTQIDGEAGGMGAGAMAEVDCRQLPMAEVNPGSGWREVVATGMLAP